jgi:hypothetical protein
MFTKMKQYHRAFLFFVTILIAASFGMGTVCIAVVSREDTEAVATFGGRKITGQEFREAVRHWHNIFRLADMLSPKAKKITQKEFPDSEEAYLRLLYARNPLWDSIYSLREAVAKLDQELDQELSKPENWRAFLRGSFPMAEMELQFYFRLPEERRNQIRRVIPQTDLWNMILLYHEGQQWGIQVTPQEITQFAADTQKAFGSGEAYQHALTNRQILGSDMERMSDYAITVLKYLQARCCGAKVAAESVYQTYAQFHNEYRLQWAALDVGNQKVRDDAAYQQERVAFYEQKKPMSPTYFQLSATADFDFLFVPNANFIKGVTVTREEIDAYLQRQEAQHEEGNDEAESEKHKEAEQKLLQEKGKDRAREFVTQIYSKVVALADAMSFNSVAAHYDLVYESKTNVAEENFLQEAHVGTPEAKNLVYQALDKGAISSALAYRDEGYFIVRLLNRKPARDLSRDEVAQDDVLFLDRYYQHNKHEFAKSNRYRLAYVMVDYSAVKQHLLITTPIMKNFYDKYKDMLYRLEQKDKDGNEYKPFAEVRSDIEARVANSTCIQELQKLHMIHQLCKERGKDADVKTIVKELAAQIMLAPDSLKYVEMPVLQSEQEIRADNPLADSDFSVSPNADSQLSEVKDSAKGKYFYKVLDKEDKPETELNQIRDEVKNHFLKQQAVDKLRNQAREFQKEYTTLLAEAKKNIAEGADKEQKAEEMARKLFQAVAFKNQLATGEHPFDENLLKIEELKGISQLASVVPSLKPGETSEPLADTRKGTVFVVQLTAKRTPAANEIPRNEWRNIYNALWERAYRTQRNMFLNHKLLSERLHLERKKKDMERDFEE